MSIEQSSNERAQDKLIKITVTARERLQEEMRKSIRTVFDEVIMPACITASNRGDTSTSILFSLLKLKTKDFEDEKNKPFIWTAYEELIISEGLKMSIYWDHPDCSIYDNCGPGCRPTWLHISWG